MNNAAIVTDMLTALQDGRRADALAKLTDDVVWHNVSLPKVRGKHNVERALAQMERLSIGFEVVFHHVIDDGGVVLTERTDTLSVGRLRWPFWVCGTFEIRDGRIAVWRDYFDWANITFGLTRGVVGFFLPQRKRAEALSSPGRDVRL